MIAAKLAELTTLIERQTGRDGVHPTALGPLVLNRGSAPSEPVAIVCEPALCLIAQGRKRILLGDEVYLYDSANFLLVSVGLPVVGQVTQASPSEPYLSLRLDLDMGQVGESCVAADRAEPAATPPGRGLGVSPTDAPLLDAVTRLVALLEAPADIPVMAPLILREVTYRLLRGEQGGRLRQIAAAGGQSRRIALAIDWLRRRFDQPIRVDEMARAAHMSPSALHHHFKLVTALSPLQYQKRLRLQEARCLMLGAGLDAAAAGYRVGYESPSQFSREYRRLFGRPPRLDLEWLRAVPAEPGGVP